MSNCCNNYEICENIVPTWWNDNKCNNLCLNCQMLFGFWIEHNGREHIGKGLLTFIDNIECPICLETKRCVSQPRCDHYCCIECFKRCYYGREMPEFPYPEMENEYYEDMENTNYDYNRKWDNYREKIDEYNKKCDIIENTNENHLRKCPLCRK